MKTITILCLIVLFALILPNESLAVLSTGDPAPDFTLKTTSGEEVTLSEYKGQVVILHFWKSNWRQCHAEIPHLKKIVEAYPEDQVKILSMNAINPAKQAEAEAKRYEIEFPVLVCRQTGVVRDYQVTKLPHLFIIDQEGVIRESKLFLKSSAIQEVLDGLLAEPAESETTDE